MKIAVISDVHSNLEALTACCRHAETHRVSRYVCLGDCIGYGADPGATLSMLMSLPGLIGVRGNHDDGLFSSMGMGTRRSVRDVIEWTRGQLTPEQLKFLAGLPYVREAYSATFVHASASSPEAWEYLIRDEQVSQCMNASGSNLTFVGHVHVPRVFYEIPSGGVRELVPHGGEPIVLSPGLRYVINVGSVGQPRDHNSAACYVHYDTDLRHVTFHRVSYDYFATGRKIREADLNPFYAERLEMGC